MARIDGSKEAIAARRHGTASPGTSLVPTGGRERAVSLRERKKQAIRTALRTAAVRLAIERGPDRVLVEDIAAEAGVAPRTFSNYFPSKEAAIIADWTDRAAIMQSALRAWPIDEPLWVAVRHAVLELVAGQGEPDRVKARLINTTPTLRVEQLRSDDAVQQVLAEEIAVRTGTDPQRDLYPRLAAAAIIAATRAAIDHWVDSDPSTPLTDLVDDALRQVTEGLPAPKPRGSRRSPTRRS